MGRGVWADNGAARGGRVRVQAWRGRRALELSPAGALPLWAAAGYGHGAAGGEGQVEQVEEEGLRGPLKISLLRDLDRGLYGRLGAPKPKRSEIFKPVETKKKGLKHLYWAAFCISDHFLSSHPMKTQS